MLGHTGVHKRSLYFRISARGSIYFKLLHEILVPGVHFYHDSCQSLLVQKLGWGLGEQDLAADKIHEPHLPAYVDHC